MFNRTLTEMLQFAEKQDRYAVLASVINEQLSGLASSPASVVHKTLNKYYKVGSDNYEMLKKAAEENAKQRPLLFCCYALVTNNINALDKADLEQTINWLSKRVEDNPRYETFLRSMIAIQTVKNYDLMTKIELPDNCYINLAGAVLPGADLKHLDLQHANLVNANLKGADFTGSNLSGAILDKDTNLAAATMHKTCLKAVNLVGNFRDADLTGADLSQAKLCHRHLDLNGVKLAGAQMDQSTQFFYLRGNAPARMYNKYLAEKKAMLAQVAFLDENQFNSTSSMNKALVHLYLMLKDNRDFPRMQECIAHDFIVRAQMLLQANPDLARLTSRLRDVAYVNPMFEHSFGLFRGVNEVYETFASAPGEERAIESAAQERMRVALRR